MKHEDFGAVEAHSEKIGSTIDRLVAELASELGVSHEQIAALSIYALARRFFPNFDTDNSVSVTVLLEDEGQISPWERPILDARGKPIEGEQGPLVLEIPGIAIPFDNPVDAIIYSEQQDLAEES